MPKPPPCVRHDMSRSSKINQEQWAATQYMKHHETIFSWVQRKPKKQRRLNFAEIAQHCRVGASEVGRQDFEGDNM